MVPGGVLYALFLAQAPEIALVDRALNWLLFMLLIPVWLQMSYITAAKDYKRILYVFALGIGAALGLGCCFIALGLRVTTSLMAAMATGYGIMLVGFMRVLLRYFPAGSGSPFAFTAWFNRTPSLLGRLVPPGRLARRRLFFRLSGHRSHKHQFYRIGRG